MNVKSSCFLKTGFRKRGANEACVMYYWFMQIHVFLNTCIAMESDR